MKLRKLLWRGAPTWLLEALQGLAFAATVAGAGYFTLQDQPPDPAATIAATTALFTVYLYIVLSKELGNKYVFKRGSEDEAKFFASWYSEPGVHSIFCDDLDWMEGQVGSRICAALCATAGQKGSKVRVFVRQPNQSVADQLHQAGVELRDVPDHVTSQARFSLRSYEEEEWMIIRHSSGDRKRTVFIESQDQYLRVLARDFFASCNLVVEDLETHPPPALQAGVSQPLPPSPRGDQP